MKESVVIPRESDPHQQTPLDALRTRGNFATNNLQQK